CIEMVEGVPQSQNHTGGHGMVPTQMNAALKVADPRWQAMQFVNPAAYGARLGKGSGVAIMYDAGSRSHHFVVVDSISETHVSVRDPWEGTSYSMDVGDFDAAWTGLAWFKQ